MENAKKEKKEKKEKSRFGKATWKVYRVMIDYPFITGLVFGVVGGMLGAGLQVGFATPKVLQGLVTVVKGTITIAP